MTERNISNCDDSKSIQKEVDRWKSGLAIFAFALIAIYAMAFFTMNDFPNSLSEEKWGQFGDFIGGIMNPLVAFAAFYWLTQSIKIQKDEIQKTHAELREASIAQNKLVQQGEITTRISALTGIIQSTDNAIAIMTNRMNSARSALRDARINSDSEDMKYQQSRVDHFAGRINEFESLSFAAYKELSEIMDSTKLNRGTNESSPP